MATETVTVELAVRMLPEVPSAYGKAPSIPHAFTGFNFGPFFVHQGISDDGEMRVSDFYEEADLWHVSHVATGLAVQKGIPHAARALWLAKKLSPLKCFEHDDKDRVIESASDEDKAQMLALRADARMGDCQGVFHCLDVLILPAPEMPA